ncbi:MAG: NTP transferase domain-containing protein, partial [Pseudomonadota bacterium]
KGQILGTIKVITFALPKNVLDEMHNLPKIGGIRLHAYRGGTVQLLFTEIPGVTKGLYKAEKIITDRLHGLRYHLQHCTRTEHRFDAIIKALQEHEACDLLLISSASAMADRRDIIPQAIEKLGGTIQYFGIPVDPGNLMMIATLRGTAVLGLPGCAKSPALNGTDFLLQRHASGLVITREYIASLGAGGLLKDIHNRPMPRIAATKTPPSKNETKTAAIILAAGFSRRFGDDDKLLQIIDDKPLLHATLAPYMQAKEVRHIIVVVQSLDTAIAQSLRNLPVQLVANARANEGISTSIQSGLAALPETYSAAFIGLGDMPNIQITTLHAMIVAHTKQQNALAILPVHNKRIGNPVLVNRAAFPAMMELSGDKGARTLWKNMPHTTYQLSCDDPGIHYDIDTCADLASRR